MGTGISGRFRTLLLGHFVIRSLQGRGCWHLLLESLVHLWHPWGPTTWLQSTLPFAQPTASTSFWSCTTVVPKEADRELLAAPHCPSTQLLVQWVGGSCLCNSTHCQPFASHNDMSPFPTCPHSMEITPKDCNSLQTISHSIHLEIASRQGLPHTLWNC